MEPKDQHFQTIYDADYSAIAPDQSEVWPLVRTDNVSCGRVVLQAGRVSLAVRHRAIEEVWYVLSGQGEMWRKSGETEEIVELAPGVCLTIPAGCIFQFRTGLNEPLEALIVTVPPWPGDAEAIPEASYWPLPDA